MSVAPRGTSDILARMRAITPRRALAQGEAEVIAERQATVLREVLGYAERATLPTSALTGLPFATVTYREKFPTSGMATKTGLGWVIVIRASEPLVRQRFSLAHELKHVIDDPLMDVTNGGLPQGLYPDARGYSAHERAERICDIFAATLLMPKRALRRDWVDGFQQIAGLARRYDVSRVAMEIRLTQLGLLAGTSRCAVPVGDGSER